MILSHKIRIYPTKKQEILLIKSCGVARFAYNWGLAEWKKQYENGEKPNGNKLKKQFNSIKKSEFTWVYECPKDANQKPFIDLQNSFTRFFKKISGFPKFKKKGQRDSFYISNDQFSIKSGIVKLPRIGNVKISESLRFDGKIMSATISRTADMWFISISVEIKDYQRERIFDNKIGIDLGIKDFIITSNGNKSGRLNPLKQNLKKLRKLSRRHSRKKKGSKNRNKSRIKLAKLHYKITCKRKDSIHKVTNQLCKENQFIAIEDLNVKGMIKNRKLSRSITDVGWAKFRRQLGYKSLIYNNIIIVINRFFPSSKQCSNCGCLKDDLKLSDRIYKCEHCGYIIDRDINASINILNEGLRILMANEEFTSVDMKAMTEGNLPSVKLSG